MNETNPSGPFDVPPADVSSATGGPAFVPAVSPGPIAEPDPTREKERASPAWLLPLIAVAVTLLVAGGISLLVARFLGKGEAPVTARPAAAVAKAELPLPKRGEGRGEGAERPEKRPARPVRTQPSAVMAAPAAVRGIGEMDNLPPAGLVADEAYPFVATTLDGKRIALEDLKGRPVVLTFFMIGCSICWDDLPALQKFQAEHANDGTAFVIISSEDAVSTREAFSSHPVDMPIVADPDGVIRAAYPGMGWPTFVVLDARGRYFEQTTFGNINDDISARLDESLRFVRSDPEIAAVRSPVDPVGRCRLAGQVRGRKSHQPVARADVIFWANRPVQGSFAGLVRRAQADEQGRFAIESVACSRNQVLVRSPRGTELWLEHVAAVERGALAPFELDGP